MPFYGGCELKAPASSLHESRFRLNLENDYLTKGRLFCKSRMIKNGLPSQSKSCVIFSAIISEPYKNRVVPAFLFDPTKVSVSSLSVDKGKKS